MTRALHLCHSFVICASHLKVTIGLRECNERVIPATVTVAYVECCEFYSIEFYGGVLHYVMPVPESPGYRSRCGLPLPAGSESSLSTIATSDAAGTRWHVPQ